MVDIFRESRNALLNFLNGLNRYVKIWFFFHNFLFFRLCFWLLFCLFFSDSWNNYWWLNHCLKWLSWARLLTVNVSGRHLLFWCSLADLCCLSLLSECLLLLLKLFTFKRLLCLSCHHKAIFCLIKLNSCASDSISLIRGSLRRLPNSHLLPTLVSDGRINKERVKLSRNSCFVKS